MNNQASLRKGTEVAILLSLGFGQTLPTHAWGFESTMRADGCTSVYRHTNTRAHTLMHTHFTPHPAYCIVCTPWTLCQLQGDPGKRAADF